jgi:hypothetical protein
MKHLVLALVLMSSLASTASAQVWNKVEKTDPLRGTPVVTFTLTGKFLTAPQGAASDAAPVMVAICQPGSFRFGTAHGKILNAHISVGTVLDTGVGSDLNTRVQVQYRLDEGKLQMDNWAVSEDFSALFYNPYDSDGGFYNMLYGHELPHKPNTSPAIKKVVIGVPSYRGGEVVMQFDMPADPTEVAETCGVIVHKRGE